MSIQQQSKFSEDRIIERAHDSLDSIVDRFQKLSSKKHASIVLEDSFWRDLQETLTAYVRRKRMLLSTGGYTDVVSELRSLETFTIRIAVEQFRARMKQDPYRIHDADAWSKFKDELRTPNVDTSASLE